MSCPIRPNDPRYPGYTVEQKPWLVCAHEGGHTGLCGIENGKIQWTGAGRFDVTDEAWQASQDFAWSLRHKGL